MQYNNKIDLNCDLPDVSNELLHFGLASIPQFTIACHGWGWCTGDAKNAKEFLNRVIDSIGE